MPPAQDLEQALPEQVLEQGLGRALVPVLQVPVLLLG